MNLSHEEVTPLIASYEFGLLRDADRKKVEEHFLECNLCFESAYRFSPVAAAIRKNSQVMPKVKTPRKLPQIRWLMPAVLAIFLVTGFWIIEKTTVLHRELLRGGAQIQLLAPPDKGFAAVPVHFRWEEEPEASFYRIYIFSGSRKIVTGVQIDRPEFLLHTALTPDDYSWNVESYYSDGSRIRGSVTNTFEIQ